ncbi:Resolvase [Pseudomonas amygdali pv. sesami]|nr:Resolvase [Pseudomonas amygdali pv. sesami]
MRPQTWVFLSWSYCPRNLTIRGYQLFEISQNPERLKRAKDFITEGLESGALQPVVSSVRLSRLPVDDWAKLKAIDSKGLRIVELDLPTSHQGMQDTKGDEFTGRMLGAINSMLVEK